MKKKYAGGGKEREERWTKENILCGGGDGERGRKEFRVAMNSRKRTGH